VKRVFSITLSSETPLVLPHGGNVKRRVQARTVTRGSRGKAPSARICSPLLSCAAASTGEALQGPSLPYCNPRRRLELSMRVGVWGSAPTVHGIERQSYADGIHRWPHDAVINRNDVGPFSQHVLGRIFIVKFVLGPASTVRIHKFTHRHRTLACGRELLSFEVGACCDIE
jgi:hypothetical protein